MFKKILSVILISTFFAAVTTSGAVFADFVTATGGSNPSQGSGCGDYWDTCYGLSWQTYKVDKKLPSDGVYMTYTKDTGGPVKIKKCPVGSIIYNYGFEAHNQKGIGYQVSTQWNKNYKQAKHASVAKGNYTLSSAAYGVYTGNIQDYTADEVDYVSMEKAEYDFAEMLYKLHGATGPDAPNLVNSYGLSKPEIDRALNWDDSKIKSVGDLMNTTEFDSLWAKIGAFCYSESIPDPGEEDPKFFSSSSVTVTKADKTQTSATTGIVDASKKVNTTTVEVTVDDNATITFLHDLYSDIKVTDQKQWKVTRQIPNQNSVSWTRKNGDGATSGKTAFNNKSNDYYIADTRNYTYSNNKYLMLDEYSATFKKVGTYEFCQKIEFESFSTEACATIEVKAKEDPNFFAASTGSITTSGNQGGRQASTGIVGTNTTTNAETINVTAGTTATLTFSHNLYSDIKVSEDRTWNMSRDLSSGVTLIGGTGGTSTRVTSGKTKFEGYDKSSGKYIANNRKYSDGSNKYVVYDKYTTKFTKPGHYKFCEWIVLYPDNDSYDNFWAGTCIYINVDTPPCQGTDCECYGINCPAETANPCGQPLPASYTRSNASSGTTSVISLVRNLSLTNQYRSYQSSVYAKPTDTVNWCHGYYPGVQYAVDTTVTHNNEHPEPREDLWYSNTLYNHKFSEYTSWTNKFDITSTNVSPKYSDSETFPSGMTDTKEDTNSDTVDVGQAGQTLKETITSGYPSSVSASSGKEHKWGCHWRANAEVCGERCTESHDEEECEGEGDDKVCETVEVCDKWEPKSCYIDECYHTNEYYQNSMSGTATASSSVKVPYNFTNSATVEIKNEVTYAGETVTIDSASVTVSPKENNVTQGTYATQVKSAQARLIGYLSTSDTGTEQLDFGSSSSDLCSALPVKDNSCNILENSTSMTFNSSANMSGSKDESISSFVNKTYNVYDSTAGDYFCAVVAIYPYSSGDDTNMDTSGSDSWYISAPSCRVIAKRPSFQVWGGSFYSEKSVNTSNAAKNNILGIYTYDKTSHKNTTIFGSWVEQAVLANGLVSGLASGAAIGESGSKEGSSPNYCTYRVPLSIANYSLSTSESICPSYQQIGNASLTDSAIDRGAIMSYWGVLNASYVSKSDINLASDYIETTTVQGNQVRYTEPTSSINQISLTSATIPKGVTHIVHSSHNIKINGNIAYQSTTYTSKSEIPKLLIYAEGNITIGCNVGRIDAILIADGRVTTCDSTNFDSSTNARQLKINGMVIADGLVLNRTYGAGAGSASSIPAEIINYDTSAIVWGKGMSESNKFESLTTVYQHELAPRY